MRDLNCTDIIDLLEQIDVIPPGAWENEQGPPDWYAVADDEEGGIIAYFRDERAAFRFRLDYINRILNP